MNDITILIKRKEMNLRKWDKVLDYCEHSVIILDDRLYDNMKQMFCDKNQSLVLYFIVNDFSVYNDMLHHYCFNLLRYLVDKQQTITLRLIILNSFDVMCITQQEMIQLYHNKNSHRKDITNLLIYLSSKLQNKSS